MQQDHLARLALLLCCLVVAVCLFRLVPPPMHGFLLVVACAALGLRFWKRQARRRSPPRLPPGSVSAQELEARLRPSMPAPLDLDFKAEPESLVPWREDVSVLVSPERFGYRAFTTAHDEIVDAASLAPVADLARLRTALDAELDRSRARFAPLADRLRGVLADGGARDVAVTLLIDNSGSMRHRPIEVAACCADSLARSLEASGAAVEILGFTTKEWKGGQSRRDWLAAGKPARPGRLNDLRHIVYKPFGVAYADARNAMALMLAGEARQGEARDKHPDSVVNGVLKENIDGRRWCGRTNGCAGSHSRGASSS